MPVFVIEANQKASSIFAQYDYDVLDMHYYMINQTQRRSTDGIHWNSDDYTERDTPALYVSGYFGKRFARPFARVCFE